MGNPPTANLWVESRFLSRDLVEHVLHVRPVLFVVDRLLVVADQLMLHGIDNVDIGARSLAVLTPGIMNKSNGVVLKTH